MAQPGIAKGVSIALPLSMLVSIIMAGFLAPLFVTGWDTGIFQIVTDQTLLPKMQLWLILIIAQAVLWVVCIFYLVSGLQQLIRSTPLAGRHMFSAAQALSPAILLLILLVLRQLLSPPPLFPARLGGYSISHLPMFGGAGTLLAGWAVWQMYVICSLWESEFGLPAESGRKIERYIALREEVLRLLLFAAVILALGTLAGAALRVAVNTDRGEDYFPREYVIIYGAVYSLLLFAGYAPIYARFFRTGLVLRQTFCNEPKSLTEFKDWKESREAINDTLGLTLTGNAAVGPALAALLPVFSAWVATVLEVKK